MANPDYQQFWRTVTDNGRRLCALVGTPCHRCRGTGVDRHGGPCLRCTAGVIECSSILDAHHFVPKRRLRTTAAKVDVRNGVCLCRDHHDLVEQGYLRSPRPPELAFFINDHGVEARDVPEGRTAAPGLRLRSVV